MDRRKLLRNAAALAVLGSTSSLVPGSTVAAATPPPRRRVRPYDPEWPSAADWNELRLTVGGRLQAVVPPLAECRQEPDGLACKQSLEAMANPFYVQDQAGGTQAAGWVDGWTAAPSIYAVVPDGPQDVAAAVNFARTRNLRLVVKGGGHSRLGQSSAPDSLLVWTRNLDRIELHDGFVPQGCDGKVAAQPAVSVGSGARYIQLYQAVTTKAGRYVQGAGGTSVGVGGHVQAGGFGSFSTYGGLAAAALLEAEIVTADGEIRVVNACRDPELFAALQGGGAGFGITTRLTLATRPLPERLGVYGQSIKAKSEAGFRQLLEAFAGFAASALVNPHWGERVTATPENVLQIDMVFQGLTDAEAKKAWVPFQTWLADNRAEFADAAEARIVTMPGRNWWDYDYRRTVLPKSIVADDRENAEPGRFWWAGDGDDVGMFLAGCESLWLPATLLQPDRRAGFAEALHAASRRHPVVLHFNKGLAGADEARRKEAAGTAIHPDALDAFALAVVSGGQSRVYPGVLGHEPDLPAAREEGRRIAAAAAALRKVAPNAGSYCAEMGFFADDWRAAAWGPHYDRLLATKRRYDPDGLFTGRHQVGSEDWSADGFTRRS